MVPPPGLPAPSLNDQNQINYDANKDKYSDNVSTEYDEMNNFNKNPTLFLIEIIS